MAKKAKRQKNADMIKILEQRIKALENQVRELQSRTSGLVAYGPCDGIPSRRLIPQTDYWLTGLTKIEKKKK